MTIERVLPIQFHPEGTLRAVTRWIQSGGGDDVGIAEWLKNVRRAYQDDRAQVSEQDRVATILLADARRNAEARIGVLDVGGVNAGDLVRWREWQNPEASRPSGNLNEEDTQGNGGKAYMYKSFTGLARILGVSNGLRNCMGFEGEGGSEARGTAGFVPNRAAAEDAPAGPWEIELNDALQPYGVNLEDLPPEMRQALRSRGSFTFVEGIGPVSAFQGRIDAEPLIEKVARHEQSTLAIQQLRVYAVHNGEILNRGRPLSLEEIEPYEGFEIPRVVPIPDEVPGSQGRAISTTSGGSKPPGRLTLYSSRRPMPNARLKLRPRWKVTYRTQHQMVGSKPVSELVPATPGSSFVYATVELAALEPDYVTHGRVRPNDGPLMEALDEFIAEHIRELAREINDRTRHEFDDQQLDEVARENRMLDQWKDQFLPSEARADGSGEGPGRGGRGGGDGGEQGLEPYVIEVRVPAMVFSMGKGVELNLAQLLSPVVRDDLGRSVSPVRLTYLSDNPSVMSVDARSGIAVGRRKGECQVYVQVAPSGISSQLIPFRVVAVDHVLLSPRQIEIPLGTRKQITATVTTDEGERSDTIFLNWKHDADDPLLVRIRPTGICAANRLGVTHVNAGAGDQVEGVWSRIPARIEVVDNPNRDRRGSGHPQLKITGRDNDPDTGQVREGDAQQPALWQDPVDVDNNIWWINLEAPEAALAFGQRNERAELWRMLHVAKLVEMVTQVHMQVEYMGNDSAHREGSWATYKQALEGYQVDKGPQMWDELMTYVLSGGEIVR